MPGIVSSLRVCLYVFNRKAIDWTVLWPCYDMLKIILANQEIHFFIGTNIELCIVGWIVQTIH